jgi:hypothetical protein
MFDDSYDGTVSLPRKLSEEENRELRITLLPYFHVAGGLGVEDITDFMDYTFAMISNSKAVDYVIEELIGMEMDFCNAAVAKKVGKELAEFITKITGGGGGDSPGEEEGEEEEGEAGGDGNGEGTKGPRVVSLKVRFHSHPYSPYSLRCSFIHILTS